jgi:hypothetical protein
MNSGRLQSGSSKPKQRKTTPSYPAKRISTLDALSLALGHPKERLIELAETSDQFFRLHDTVVKADGTVRELYDLNPPLKALQQTINNHFLKRCSYPTYLTGSLPGSDYRKNAARHAGQATVITIDASNFFPSISEAHVFNIWHKLFKFGLEPSRILTGLCTRSGFLAQGSPVSSYLANLAFWDIEPYIFRELESRGLRYTRYVDDIIVSSGRKLSPAAKSKVIRTAQKVFLSKGLRVKKRKTKVMDRNKRQVANNLVVNSGKPTAGRKKKDQLRAELNQFKQLIRQKDIAPEEHKRRYNSLRGKLLHLRSTNAGPAEKLLRELEDISPG